MSRPRWDERGSGTVYALGVIAVLLAAAVGIAGASISIYAFLGNLFMPLSGGLFDFAHGTPMYGVGSLALRALQGDSVATATSTGGSAVVHEALWVPIVSIAVWTLIFVLACLTAQRRTTVRR